jgi:hypothetical protein
MPAAPLVYDTNVVIRQGLENFSSGLLLSAVVVQELTAGAPDGRAVR